MQIGAALGSLVAVLLVTPSLVEGAPPPRIAHSPRIAALAKQVAAHEPGAEGAFWRRVATEGAPLLEAGNAPGWLTVTFVWRGTATTQRVHLMGPTVPTQIGGELQRVPGTNTFYTSLSLPDDGRATYNFLVDGDEHASYDPEHSHHDPFGRAMYDPMQSLVELPKAPPQPSMQPHASTAPGALYRHTVSGPEPQQKRPLFVYTPPGYSPTGSTYPLLVAFDGEGAVSAFSLPIILDELIAARRIPPVVALLVGSGDRSTELKPNPRFADFVALDLVPWVRAHYHATADPRRTVISGISLGGLGAMYAGLRHPEVYGNVLSQSGSFWWAADEHDVEQTARELATMPRQPLRVWMEVGSMEISNLRPETTMLAANRHLRDVLQARGYDISYREFDGDHAFPCWRGTIADGIAALMGTPPELPTPLRPAKSPPRPPLTVTPATALSSPLLERAALLDGGEAAVTLAKKLMAVHDHGYPLDEDEINDAGCLLLIIGHARESLALLRWNTERFPKSANTWDSLAWAYYAAGDRPHAVESFKVDVRLDPRNQMAAQMLAELTMPPP